MIPWGGARLGRDTPGLMRDVAVVAVCAGYVFPVPVIDEDADVGYWRARAGRAEARVAELEAATAALRADKAGLTARVAELAGQVARLQESVTTLSGLLFGSSSEKGGSSSRGNGRAGGDRPGGAGKRGQRPGGPGHGRRDHSHLETEERVIDVDAGQRRCAECGEPFEFLGTEDSEQIDWQVKITRIVWRRRRYRRRCSHPGPATVCAPPAPRPVPKGLFTAGFLARLAYEKHVLGRPVHRIVKALAADGFDVAPGTLVRGAEADRAADRAVGGGDRRARPDRRACACR